MNDPATLPATVDAPPIAPARPGFRLFQAIAGPVAFVLRRPGRAALWAGLGLLLLAGVGAAGAYGWFEYHLRAARSALAAGHNADAIRHLKRCYRLAPGHRDVLLMSARAARRAGSWEEADGLMGQYWRRYGDEEPLVFERLLFRASQGDLETAGPRLRAAIAAGGPDARLAREALTTGLSYRFLHSQVRTEIEKWLADTPDDPLAWLNRGKLFEQLQGFDEAIGSYRRAIELDPEQLEARLRLAGILVTRRLGEEAAAELAVLRERLPEHAEVQVLWARALAELGRTPEARAEIDACLQAHPDYPAALLERGIVAILDGDDAAAEKFLARAVRLEPGNAQFRNKYAFVLGRLGNTSRAAEEYARGKQLEDDVKRINQLIHGAFQDNPNDPALHYEIGTIALRGGLITEALRWFTSALQVDPNHLPTHRMLAVLYRELEKPALAAKHHAIAQRLSGGKKGD